MPSRPKKRIQNLPGGQPEGTKKTIPVNSVLPAKLAGMVGSAEGARPVWRLTLLDREHEDNWSWNIDQVTLLKIISFMRDMESLTWREIRSQVTGTTRRGPKHKSIPVDHLNPIAQSRLRQLNLDDQQELFRFRTGNMERLWGILTNEDPKVFYPIWWDPGHQVCPSKDR